MATVSRLFDDYPSARRALKALVASGVPEADISIVANNSDNFYNDRANIDRDNDGVDDRAEGAGTGGTVGAVAGGAIGLLTGLGMMAIPGVGPVVAAGWLASTALGALAGGATGSLIGALVESGYHPLGGATVIHFIGVNAMDAPATCVPPQHHSSRRLAHRDMLFVEFTGTFWDSPGQVLRTISVGDEPSALFRDLHDVAEAAFDAMTGVLRAGVSARELVEASHVIERGGFAIYDDVVHGFGGGYWPPVLGVHNRDPALAPDMQLETNMTIVVQPNVITRDERAGVQLGELVRITGTGFERMHHAPWGFLRMA